MTLFRYNNDLWRDPFTDLDQMFNRMFGSRGPSPFYYNESTVNSGFRADLFADKNGYKVIAELPGIPKDQIDVSLENAVINITAETRLGSGDSEKTVKLSRSITVNDDVNPGKVAATYKDGLLAIDLPKREERKPRMIKVKG